MDFDGVRYEFPHKNVIYWMKVAHKNVKIIKSIAIYIFIAGALNVVKGIKVCLDKHRSKTMYTILGLMVGSLYAIVM